jgi:succinate dehydrogenase flavin-adding protein (antitoxin of CptAB toxin-antitoxin module)
MRELDILLGDFLENDFPQAAPSQKAAFRALLTLPDPDLVSYLLGGEIPTEQDQADVVAIIRNKAPP